MSDPFSIATGTAGIISLGLTIAQGLFQIADGIGSAGQEVRTYAEEINTFSKLLKHVKDELEMSTDVSADIQSLVNDIVNICGRVLKPLDGLQKTLRPLLKHFSNSPSKIRQLGLRLQWIFRKKDKVLFYRAALKEQHRILDTVLEVMILQRTREQSSQNIYVRLCLQNSMAAVSLSHQATQQMDFKICFEDTSSSKTVSSTRDLRPTERELNTGEIYEAGAENDDALVRFCAILSDSREELSDRDTLIVNGWVESYLKSESQNSAQETWHDICALQRKVLRLASCMLQSEGEFKTASNMHSPRNYTVGWICTGMVEYVSAQAFLDARHEAIEDLSPNDNNTYTLGVVGKHNVVIAVVVGQGLAAAAGVAADMRHSFPNVQIGLVVGIGGGVPSERHDIRLGDIVVSVPRDGMGGVMQYDFGRDIQGQQFQPTGFINQPPSFLRAAVMGLRSKYEREGNFLEEAIVRVLDENPRLQLNYCRPEASSDRLYRGDYVHSGTQGFCQGACDSSALIARRERELGEDKVAVHFGLIASGDQAMKDAMVRDRLAAKKDILCFDTIAAGIMNHFPCLVIHGIYNYSDSHIYNQWERYAAMAAAAWAKDLLYYITLKDFS